MSAAPSRDPLALLPQRLRSFAAAERYPAPRDPAAEAQYRASLAAVLEEAAGVLEERPGGTGAPPAGPLADAVGAWYATARGNASANPPGPEMERD